MKIIVMFALFALAVADSEYYITADDHLDMDKLLADRQTLQSYLDCYLDKGPCSEFQNSYKRHLAEAVLQGCKKCNANQKYLAWRLLSGIKELAPEEYKSFKKHYDAENKYFDALEMEISKYTKPVYD